LQFEIYSHNGYDKDILIIAMEDSSIFILEEETGKLLNPNPVQTDKPSKALLLQMLGELYGLACKSIVFVVLSYHYMILKPLTNCS
jgi:hypothetical protein